MAYHIPFNTPDEAQAWVAILNEAAAALVRRVLKAATEEWSDHLTFAYGERASMQVRLSECLTAKDKLKARVAELEAVRGEQQRQYNLVLYANLKLVAKLAKRDEAVEVPVSTDIAWSNYGFVEIYSGVKCSDLSCKMRQSSDEDCDKLKHAINHASAALAQRVVKAERAEAKIESGDGEVPDGELSWKIIASDLGLRLCIGDERGIKLWHAGNIYQAVGRISQIERAAIVQFKKTLDTHAELVAERDALIIERDLSYVQRRLLVDKSTVMLRRVRSERDALAKNLDEALNAIVIAKQERDAVHDYLAGVTQGAVNACNKFASRGNLYDTEAQAPAGETVSAGEEVRHECSCESDK